MTVFVPLEINIPWLLGEAAKLPDAVPVTLPVTAPVKGPLNAVEVRVPVLGLKESLVLDTLAGKFPVAAVTQDGYIVALVVVSSVMPTLTALVAVVEDVAVVAFPDSAPVKVVAVIT